MKRYLHGLSLLIISLIVCSNFAAALDSNITTNNNTQINMKDNLDVVYIGVNGGDEKGNGNKAKPYKTIKKGLKQVKNTGIIYILNGTYNGVNNTDIHINKDVTIIGDTIDGVVLDGNGENRLFVVEEGKTVKIRDLTLQNGKAIQGGAIYNQGNLNIKNCNILSNIATTSGGAIYNKGTLNMEFNRIIGNNAPVGMAINSEKGDVKAFNNWWGSNNNPKTENKVAGNVNCNPWIKLTITSDRNQASPDQSVCIHANFKYNSNNEDITIESISGSENMLPDIPVYFEAENGEINHSQQKIAWMNEAKTTVQNQNKPQNNIKVTADGYTITTTIFYNQLSDIYVSTQGNDLTGNGSKNNPYQTLNKAISIVNSNGYIHLAPGEYNENINKKITINKNLTIKKEDNNNGIVRFKDWNNTIFLISNKATVTLQNLNIESNNAIESTIKNQGKLILDNCVFNNNNGRWGGAIHNLNDLTIKKCVFKDNHANIASDNGNAHGGAVFNNHTVHIEYSTFQDNEALKEGGAIYNLGKLYSTHNLFQNNIARSNAGSIMNLGTFNSDFDKFISNHIETGDKTLYYRGGAIYNNGNLTANAAIFESNNADNGGAIYNNGKLNLKDKCTQFTDNHANNGGAIMNAGALDINSTSLFDKNYASHEGGAIYNDKKITLNYPTLTNNKANKGGAIYNKGEITANNSYFGSNHATDKSGSGGAIFNMGSINLIANNRFERNTATCFGGAITNLNNLNVTDIFMELNSDEGSSTNEENGYQSLGGGAIYNAGKLFVDKGTFNLNFSPNGGAIDNKESAQIKHCNFTSNGYYKKYTQEEATMENSVPNPGLHGGAIFNEGNLNAEYNTFESNMLGTYTLSWVNSVDAYGGAIYNTKRAEIKHNNFYFNTALARHPKDNFNTWTERIFFGGIRDEEKLMHDVEVDESWKRIGKDVYNKDGICDLEDNYWSKYTAVKSDYYNAIKEEFRPVYDPNIYYRDENCEKKHLRYMDLYWCKQIKNVNYYLDQLICSNSIHENPKYYIGVDNPISSVNEENCRVYNAPIKLYSNNSFT